MTPSDNDAPVCDTGILPVKISGSDHGQDGRATPDIASTAHRAARTRAFTLIELVVVTALAAVVAVTAVPLLASSSGRSLSRASRELALQIKMVRDLAASTHRRTWIEFDTANNLCNVYIESPTTPGRASRIWVTDPVTGSSQYRIQYNQGEFSGILLATASFGGRSELEFDRLGQPYNGLSAALTADGSVILTSGTASRTVMVTSETGFVREQ